MPRFMSRRKLIGAGGVAALAPIATGIGRTHAAPLPALVVLREPVRVFDSRIERPDIGGGRLESGESVAVTVGGVTEADHIAAAVFANITITGTAGSGYLVVRASDLSGESPFPPTSNINWSGPNQTLANLVITPVGGEHAIEVHAGGGGSTHFIVDVQAYVPFAIT